jgi:hypothetical protein
MQDTKGKTGKGRKGENIRGDRIGWMSYYLLAA